MRGQSREEGRLLIRQSMSRSAWSRWTDLNLYPAFHNDIPYLSNWGTPLLIGPGSIFVAHTDHEMISKKELTEAVDLYVRLGTTLMAELSAVAIG